MNATHYFVKSLLGGGFKNIYNYFRKKLGTLRETRLSLHPAFKAVVL
jgi:hypothetical protein